MGTNNSIVYEKAYQFAIRIVKVYKYWVDQKKEYVLSKQLLRSGTSIDANIAEANGAISNADFKNKISIAYKECVETKYWLSLLKETDKGHRIYYRKKFQQYQRWCWEGVLKIRELPWRRLSDRSQRRTGHGSYHPSLPTRLSETQWEILAV